MPTLPTHPIQLAREVGDSTASHSDWMRAFDAHFRRLWAQLVFVVNALCRVDTLANRTATPNLNEIFFVASNTKQLFSGVSGVWENAGPRRGTQAVAAAATTATVTLSPAEPNASYVVGLTPNYDTRFWVTGKTASQFVINVSTAGAGNVDWVLWRI